jgi:prephenate dehydratase
MLRVMNDTREDLPPSGTPRNLAPGAESREPTSPVDGATPLAAFSGEPGAFAEDAVHAYFGPASTTLAVGGFRAVFEAVADGRAAAGMIPIENLVNGTVRENYDLLLEFPLEIRGEVVVPVHLCLAALPGERLETIERVYSHIQALGQADAFLRTRPWTLLTTYNTAGAGKSIVERGERGAAAILSPRAAARFGLEILADGIESVPENRTRFLVVAAPGMELPDPAPGAAAADGCMRTTLVLGVRNEPGTLLRCLAVFAAQRLNLSSLESRPARDRPWDYVFWVDLDADVAAPTTRTALHELRGVTTLVRVLGSYRQGAGG